MQISKINNLLDNNTVEVIQKKSQQADRVRGGDSSSSSSSPSTRIQNNDLSIAQKLLNDADDGQE